MAKQRILLLRNNTGTRDDGGFFHATTPAVDSLEYGELAINYNEEDPTLFFKVEGTETNKVVSFKPSAQADWADGSGGLTSIKNQPEVVVGIVDLVPETLGQKIGIAYTIDDHNNPYTLELPLMVGVPEDDDFATDKLWGNIPVGTKASDLRKRTLAELIDWALFREIDPTVHDPSVVVTWNGPTEVVAYTATPEYTNVSVGNNFGSISRGKKPDGTIVFNQRRSPSVTTASTTIGGVAMNQTNWEAKTKRLIEFGSLNILNSGVTINYTATFAASDIIPVSNKNNDRGAAYAGGDKSYSLSSITIKGLLPWFATSNNAGELASQGNVIDTWSRKVLTFTSVAETDTYVAMFLVGGRPGDTNTAAHNVTKIEFYDSVTRTYVEDTSDWLSVKVQASINGTPCQWWKYAHSAPSALRRGITTIRVTMAA